MSLTLQLLPGEFAVCRLAATEPIPSWVGSSGFSCITRTADELSVLCPAPQVPAHVRHEAGWRLLKLQGPFAFTETGILASVLEPLAQARIAVLATATFDTDYLFVRGERVHDAQRALETAGHTFLR